MLRYTRIKDSAALDPGYQPNHPRFDLHQLYDDIAHDWYRDAPGAPDEIPAWPIITETVKRWADRGIVADAGCGTGNIARLVSPFVRTVIAFDFSHRMLSEAEQHRGDTENVLYLHADIRNLRRTFSPGSVDMALSIFAHCCMESEESLRKALYETRIIVRPGGSLLLQIPNPLQPFFTSGASWCRDLEKPTSYSDEATLVRRAIRLVSGKWIVVAHYHFQLSTYFHVLADSGFDIKEFYEPEPSPEMLAIYPELSGELRTPTSFLFLAQRR